METKIEWNQLTPRGKAKRIKQAIPLLFSEYHEVYIAYIKYLNFKDYFLLEKCRDVVLNHAENEDNNKVRRLLV